MEIDQEKFKPGPVVLFGSGETSPSGRKIFEQVFRLLPENPHVALLETPAGFEPNATQVIGRVGDFLVQRLQNYHPRVEVIHARQRGTAFSPDDPQIVSNLLQADMIFMGPGSPSYAVRQLRGSLAWQMMVARHRLGAALVFASAAVVAIGNHCLPVYEIYKVGEDLHWKEGLDFFGPYDLPLVFVPHWNNNEGGDELDTSRCFMGQERFAALVDMLPPDLTVLGIDEKTGLILDLVEGVCKVAGSGGVTLIHTGHTHESQLGKKELDGSGLYDLAQQREGHVHQYSSGATFPLSECCPMRIPAPVEGIPEAVWNQALDTWRAAIREGESQIEPPQEIIELVERRQAARREKAEVTLAVGPAGQSLTRA